MERDQGVKDDLAGLYDEHARGLRAFARGLLADEALAEDAVHQAFVGLAGTRAHVESPRAYLYGAVRNAALNLARGEKRRERTWQDACRAGRWAVFTDAEDDDQGKLDALNAAIGELPPYERQVVLLKVWGRLTFDEVGRAMETPAATAASRYRAALGRLRERMRGTA